MSTKKEAYAVRRFFEVFSKFAAEYPALWRKTTPAMTQEVAEMQTVMFYVFLRGFAADYVRMMEGASYKANLHMSKEIAALAAKHGVNL
jgi:hypothetical protein